MERNGRVLQITWQKCGSQWVRDVLSAPEIVTYSGKPYSGVKGDLKGKGELLVPDNTFAGPVYGMNAWEWQYWKQPGDRAVVVLRDPRDLVVSNMLSIMYSHASSEYIDFRRRQLHALGSERERLEQFVFGLQGGGLLRMLLTWHQGPISNALLISYEDLVADDLAGFRKIADWLEWPVPSGVLESVVGRLSFERQSGRKPGNEDRYSHHRRGVAGDWKNHFTRPVGELWERLFPGFLKAIGYEVDDGWWQDLPVSFSELELPQGGSLGHIEVIERKLKASQQQLEEKERAIQALSLAGQEFQRQLQEKESVIQELVARSVASADAKVGKAKNTGLISRAFGEWQKRRHGGKR